MSQKITIKDVAEACNVSTATVSLVINNVNGRVSEEVYKRVLKKCEELNYVPNSTACDLKKRTSKTVALIVPDIENGYFSRLVKVFEELLSEKKYSLIVFNTLNSLEKEINAIDFCHHKNVDFLILITSRGDKGALGAEHFKKLNALHCPHLIFDRRLDKDNSPYVLSDDYYGGFIATEHLIKMGHKNIACITGPDNVSSSAERLLGYIKAHEKYNLPVKEENIFKGDYYYDSGIKNAALINKNKDITAVFAFNDLMAYGVYNFYNEHNLIIGKDISLVGYDDISFSSLIFPTLTTVKPDYKLMCERVVEQILDKERKENVLIKPSLIIRNSVRRIKL